MSRVEVYTPWREDPGSLQHRTVGRGELLDRLRREVTEHTAGRRPLHRYLFGPRGSGKSHVLSCLRAQLAHAGVDVRWIPEDIPALRDAEDLLRRIDAAATRTAAWRQWGAARPPDRPRSAQPMILIIEGLDRRLEELGAGEEGRVQRQLLRARWDQDPRLWIVGTGVTLNSPLTASDEAFFGSYDAEPVQLLSDEDAATLLERLVPEARRADPVWPARRSALVTLAGGSPRVLVALALSCAALMAPDAASDALLGAVEQFTPHFQLRFRDLPPLGQHVVDLLALAPREMTPGEIAELLRHSPQSIATTARRLDEEGALASRQEGRQTWYRLAEPLFRFWIEYRTAPWEHTRVAVATRLLEAIFTPHQIAHHWLDSPDGSGPLIARSATQGAARHETERALGRKFADAVAARDAAAAGELVQRARSFAALRWQFAVLCVRARWSDGLRPLSEQPDRTGVTSAFAIALLNKTCKPREAFRRWLDAIGELDVADPPGLRGWSYASTLVLAALAATSGAGKPWQLTAGERLQLAAVPYARAAFLARGRLPGHPPVLSPGDAMIARWTSREPDLGELLCVAAQIGAPELEARVLRVVRPPGAPPIGPCPTPWRAVSEPAALQAWLVGGLRSGSQRLTDALTWGRSFASPAPVEDLLRALAETSAEDEPPRNLSSAGLLSLGLHEPERLDAILDALALPWRERLEHLAPLARQMAEPTAGRLHPELAGIWRRLAAGDERPR